MELVHNNPYRVLGVPANCKNSEIQRNKTKLKAFLKAGQNITLDYDFPVLGKLIRTEETIEKAHSKLNLNQDKIPSGLFWFYKGSISDDPAFEYLKEDDTENAKMIWEKLTASGKITQRNYSAYINLSTLLLSQSVKNKTVDVSTFTNALDLKLRFLESDHADKFALDVTDQTYKITPDSLQELFITELKKLFSKNGKLRISKFVKILNELSFSAKENILNSFASSFYKEITDFIEQSKSSRNSDPSSSISTAKNLINNTKEHLTILKLILGTGNIKYSNINDKVADELLSCGFAYFKKYKDSTSADPSTESMEIFQYAKGIARGSLVKQKCDENIKGLQEWIDEKPIRLKKNRVKSELTSLENIFAEFANVNETIGNARLLASRSKPLLQKVKSVLGASDELYITISTNIADQAQGYIISQVNRTIDLISKQLNQYSTQYNPNAYSQLEILKSTFNDAWSVTLLLDDFDMKYDYRTNRFNKNKAALKDYCDKFGVSTYSTPSHSTSRPNSVSNNTTKPSPVHQPVHQESDFKFAPNAWWILGLIGGIIGAIAGGGGGFLGGLIIGGFIGFQFR